MNETEIILNNYLDKLKNNDTEPIRVSFFEPYNLIFWLNFIFPEDLYIHCNTFIEEIEKSIVSIEPNIEKSITDNYFKYYKQLLGGSSPKSFVSVNSDLSSFDEMIDCFVLKKEEIDKYFGETTYDYIFIKKISVSDYDSLLTIPVIANTLYLFFVEMKHNKHDKFTHANLFEVNNTSIINYEPLQDINYKVVKLGSSNYSNSREIVRNNLESIFQREFNYIPCNHQPIYKNMKMTLNCCQFVFWYILARIMNNSVETLNFI